MRVALVLAPYYVSGAGPPQGLARVATELRLLGHDPIVYDLDFEIAFSDPALNWRVRKSFGVASDLPAVTFLVKPDVVLYDLFRREYDRAGITPILPEHREDVAVLRDALVHFEPWIDRLVAEAPEAVLFSAFASNLALTLCLARRVRDQRPEVPILFGGPGAGPPEMRSLLFKLGLADGVAVGEGEETLRELFRDGKLRPFDGVAGVATRVDGALRYAPRALIRDLDSLADTDFDGFPIPGRALRDYGTPSRTHLHLPIEGTRGCPLHCTFCSETVYWERFRKRSPGRVVDEMERHVARTGIRDFVFTDSLLNAYAPWLEDLCREIVRRGLEIRWGGEMRPVKNLTPEICRLMKQAGAGAISLGVETLDQKFRDFVEKHTSEKEIWSSLDNLVGAGIAVDTHLLVGFPGETLDDVLSTLKKISDWEGARKGRGGPEVSWGPADILRVEPHAPLFRSAARYGIRLRRTELPAPPGREDLGEELSGILWSWEDDIPVEEKHFRAVLLRRVKELIAGGI